MIVSEQIYSNGKITFFCGSDKGNNFIKITANGENLRSNDESLKMFNDSKNAQINIRNCRECYINALCSKGGYKIVTNNKGNNLEYNLLKT